MRHWLRKLNVYGLEKRPHQIPYDGTEYVGRLVQDKAVKFANYLMERKHTGSLRDTALLLAAVRTLSDNQVKGVPDRYRNSPADSNAFHFRGLAIIYH